jgi:hypothetical protein
MTDHHTFIDSGGHVLAGKERVLAAWDGFFTAFRDYRERVVGCVDGQRKRGRFRSISLLDGRSAGWTCDLDRTNRRRSSLGMARV